MSALAKAYDLRSIYGGFPPLIDPALLGFRYPFHLPFPAKVSLELSKNAEHVQEALACRSGGINGLLRGPESYAKLIEFVDDVLEVPDGTGQPVHTGVAWARGL